MTSADVGVWYHVHNTLGHPGTTALTFAEGWGSTRFAPIAQADGTPVHTYYVASTTEAVTMESVLHDVALSPPGIFEVDKLRHYHLVKLELPPSLQCVSFHTHDLPRLQQISRAQMIDSLPACYPETRAWAQAAYLQRTDAQAISYGSKRNDSGRCLMLFKQRMPDPPFQVLGVEPSASGVSRFSRWCAASSCTRCRTLPATAEWRRPSRPQQGPQRVDEAGATAASVCDSLKQDADGAGLNARSESALCYGRLRVTSRRLTPPRLSCWCGALEVPELMGAGRVRFTRDRLHAAGHELSVSGATRATAG